jgi:hypothetical protein
VLGDRDAASGDDERRRSRDVDRVGAVAARADDVEHQREAVFDADAPFAHRARRADDLVDRLAFRGERREQRGGSHRREGLVHDRTDRLRHLPRAKILTCENPAQKTGIVGAHRCRSIVITVYCARRYRRARDLRR